MRNFFFQRPSHTSIGLRLFLVLKLILGVTKLYKTKMCRGLIVGSNAAVQANVFINMYNAYQKMCMYYVLQLFLSSRHFRASLDYFSSKPGTCELSC